MENREKFLQGAAIKANLPGEKIPGTSLVELFGKNRVLIENHCGIIAYSDSRICTRTAWGEIAIEGNGLRIACMTKQQLVILGETESVKLIKRG